MAPTPFLATGKLRATYVVQTLTHVQDIACNLDLAFTPPKIIVLGAGASITGQHALDIWWTTVSAFYAATTLDPNFILYQRAGTTFIPVDSGPGTGGPGTNIAAASLATLLSFTFRDVTNRLIRFGFNEVSYAAPGRSTVNATPAAFTAFTNSVLGNTPSDIGYWAQSRLPASTAGARFLFWTNTLSRKTRKRRGLI